MFEDIRNLRIEDFNYPLPDERIAKHPLAEREKCKLLYYRPGEIAEYRFSDVPALLPTATIMFIMRMGSVMSVGFEKVYLLQNTLNSTSSEIISTYVYKMGLVSSQYSLSAAIGLFNNIINLVLLLAVNFLSSKMSDTSLI